jgi:drug/metabolite transporter (DMT)-like permease
LTRLEKPRLLPWLALITVWVVWGSTYLGIRAAVDTIPPLLMAGFRFLLAGALMLAIVGPAHARGEQRPTWRHIRSAVIIGALMLAGGNGLLSVGEQYVDSGLAALIVATVPVWMVLINAGVTRTPVSRAVILALALGTIGIGVLLGGPGGTVHLGGALLILVASVFWASGSVYARTAPLPTSLAMVTAMEMIAGGLLLIIIGAVSGEFGRLRVADISASSLVGFGWLIFAGSMVAFTAYVYANKTLPNDIVASYAYVNPVVAVVIGAVAGGEAVTLIQVIGGAIIVSSVVVLALGRRQRRLPPPPVITHACESTAPA